MDEAGRLRALELLVEELCALTGALVVLEGPCDGTVTRFGTGGVAEACARTAEEGGWRWRIAGAVDGADHAAAERDRARYRAIVEAQTDWIARERPNGRLTFVNDAYCRWMGMTSEELLSPDYCGLDLVDDAGDLGRFHANRAALRPERPTAVNELRTRHPDGSKRWEQWTDTAIFDAKGRVVEYQLVGREITEQKRNELALRASEERYRNVIESQYDLITRVRPDGRVSFVNDAYCRYMGMTREQLSDPAWDDLSPLSPADRVRIEAEWARLTPDAPTWSHETEVQLPDGRRRIEQWSQRGIFDEQGRLVEVQGVGRDVTEQRKAEHALLESEERYRAVVEDLTEVIGRYDPDFRLTFANSALARASGRTPEEMIGSDFFAEVPPRLCATLRQRLLALSPEQPTDVGENEKILPDGTELWFHWTNRALFDADRRLVGYQSVGRDITEIRRAEAVLREREALLSAIIATQTEWVTRESLDNRYTFVNEAYCRYKGMSAKALCDPSYDDCSSIDPEDRARFLALRETMTPERPSYQIELTVLMPDGTRRIEEWVKTAIFDRGGRRVGYQSVGRDITEQREAAREIQRQREQLLHQEKLTALGSLLAGVAHELNNPLSVVVDYAALLREDARDKKIRDSAKQIHTAAQRCARIVNTFLAMARQKPPAFGPVDLAASIDEALEIVGYPLRSSGVTVAKKIAADLPAVQADPDQLHQVITNLVINAQQALAACPEPRQIELSASVTGGMIELAVADNGPGIPRELRRRVFEPFFTTKPQGVGTGLGLAVCHGIVATHQGTIDIDPRAAGGTVVRVRLPIAEGSCRTPRKVAPKASGSILVVDDEPAIVSLVGEALRRDGHRIKSAADGRAALALLDEVDLVITDLRMPGMDGMSLIEEIRAVRPRLADTALIMTGDTLRATADPALVGFGGRVVEKPVDLAALRRRVRRSLGRRKP